MMYGYLGIAIYFLCFLHFSSAKYIHRENLLPEKKEFDYGVSEQVDYDAGNDIDQDEIPKDAGPCTKNPCKNGGVCAAVKNGYKCICTDDYSGQNCQIKNTDFCETKGNEECDKDNKLCVNTGTNFVCGECKEGFVKDQNEKCVQDVCKTKGNGECDKENKLCINTGSDYDCGECKEGFVKDQKENCVQESERCGKYSCENGGQCTETKEGSKKCRCEYPYGGDNCTSSFWCAEGMGKTACPEGKCIFNFTTRLGRCECPPKQYYNFEKMSCEVVCNVHTCEHGTCEMDEEGYYCRCEEGFIGRHCDKKTIVKSDHTILMTVVTVFCSIIVCFAIGTSCFVLRKRRNTPRSKIHK